MKKITSVKEREEFLGENIKQERGAYFIVKHDNETELLWFTKYENWCEDGSDWYLEAPNYMRRFKVETEEDKANFEDFGCVIKNDGYAYEIDSPQTAPFLPEELEIEYLGYEEEDAVNWLLENTYANAQWRN